MQRTAGIFQGITKTGKSMEIIEKLTGLVALMHTSLSSFIFGHSEYLNPHSPNTTASISWWKGLDSNQRMVIKDE